MALRPFGMCWIAHHPLYCDPLRHCRVDEQRGCGPRRNSFIVCIERNGRFSEYSRLFVCFPLLRLGSCKNWLVRLASDVERNIVSVERIIHYTNELPSEAPSELPDSKPPAGWPGAGEVEFR
jgi:hypothetical protein